MDSAKYQSGMIDDIEILCECVVFLQTDISLYMISRHAITLKVLEHSKNVKEYPFLNDYGNGETSVPKGTFGI